MRYELKIKYFKKFDVVTKANLTLLGNSILINDQIDTNMIETEIGYTYQLEQYWGSLDGVSTGSPTKVFEPNSVNPINIVWGIQNSNLTERVMMHFNISIPQEYILNMQLSFQTKSVRSSLQPGTALNVTVWGNYTREEKPYKAKLTTYYKDSNETLTREVDSTVSLCIF